MDSSTLRSPLSALAPPAPICVATGTSVSDAIKKLRDKHIGCVCVVDEQKLVGIFTERDVLSKVVARGIDIDATPVEQVMTRDPEYLFEDDQIAFALNRMHVGGFRHVPLTDLKGKPRGVVSVRDILSYLVRQIEA